MANDFTLAMEIPFSFTCKHSFDFKGQKPKTREEAILLIRNYLEEHPYEAVEMMGNLMLLETKLFSPEDYEGYDIEMEDERELLTF